MSATGTEGLEPSTFGFGDQRSTNWTISLYFIEDIYLQNFIQNQCLSITIQFLTFDSRKSDSLNSTFAFRLALIKFLRTTISLSSNFVCDSFSLSVLGQALKRLVTVSSMCYHTSTSVLSTSSSSRGLTTFVGISHLEGGFTLRCLQHLSRPGLATLLCSWRNNRSTSGQSIPVLSY